MLKNATQCKRELSLPYFYIEVKSGQAAAAPRAKPVESSKAIALLDRCFGEAKTAAAACLSFVKQKTKDCSDSLFLELFHFTPVQKSVNVIYEKNHKAYYNRQIGNFLHAGKPP